MSKRRAIVIGGSVGGLLGALTLGRAGFEVDVFERSPGALSGRGAGISTHPRLLAALAALGIETGRDFGVPLTRRVALDRDGRVIAEARRDQIATSWNRLFTLLRGALAPMRYHGGRDLVSIAETANGVTARFADGATADGEVLVAADGLRSTVHRALLPDVALAYAGYVAWRGLVPEAALAAWPERERIDEFAFSLPRAEQMIGYPVAGPGNDLRPGHRSYNFVWYRPAGEPRDLARLLTDVHGHTHRLAIPPPLIAPDVIADMRRHAEALLPPWFRAVVAETAQPFLQPIYDLECPTLGIGRVALVGDAAFVARPHVGAGVAKAADDAAALADALTAEPDVTAAIQAYSAARLPEGRRIVAQARRLGCYLATSFATPELAAEAARRADPAAVLAETAALDFLERSGRQTSREANGPQVGA